MAVSVARKAGIKGNADLIIDEITAHARGAVEINRDIDTIFEIGGQDSKYISITNANPLDFDMNKVCAAGTGSFLEEQAEKLREIHDLMARLMAGVPELPEQRSSGPGS